jgi:hypothetical protein
MSLYDRYQQANSTVIPQYEGSNGEEFVKVGEYKQGVYDQNQAQGNAVGDEASNMNVSGSGLKGVDEAATELRNYTDAQLKGLTDAGNWEDATPAVTSLGRHFANRSQEIMAPIQALSKFKEELNNKDLNYTPYQKEGLTGLAIENFNNQGGLGKNARGQYQGPTVGINTEKNIDTNAKVDGWMKDYAAHEGGTDIQSTKDGAWWIMKDGTKFKQISPQEISKHIATSAGNDNEFQAYMKQEGEIAGYHNQGARNLANLTRQRDVLQGAMDYAQKYAKNDKWTEHGMEFNQLTKYQDEKAERLAKEAKDVQSMSPLMGQGANTKMNLGEPDYDKAVQGLSGTQGNIAQNTQDIKGWQAKLDAGNLDPAARTQLQTNIASAKNRNNVLQAGADQATKVQAQAHIDAAQAMGFKDYNDFVKNGTTDINKAISTSLGASFSHLTMKNGPPLTRDELKEAIATGRVKVNHFDPIATGLPGTTSIGKASVSGVTIIRKDGTQVELPNNFKGEQLGNAIDQMKNDNNSKLSQFDKKMKAAYTDNATNLSIQSTDIDIPSAPMREAMTRQLRSHADGTTYTQPGQVTPVDAPPNIRVIGLSTAGGDGTRTKVEVLDADNKPTGKYLDAITTNDNYSDEMSRILETSGAPEAQLMASVLKKGSPAKALQKMSPGDTVPVPEAPTTGSVRDNSINGTKPLDLHVSMNKDPKSKQLVWNLVDSEGNVLDTKNTAGEAALWMSGALPGKVNPKSYAKRPSP